MNHPTVTALNALAEAHKLSEAIRASIDTQLQAIRDSFDMQLQLVSDQMNIAANALTVTVIENGASRDDIQAALDGGGNIFIDAGEYYVPAGKPLLPVSNTNITKHPDAHFYIIPNSEPGYVIWQLDVGCINTHLKGGKLFGDRDKHQYIKFPPVQKRNDDGSLAFDAAGKPIMVPNSKDTHEHGYAVFLSGCQGCSVSDMEMSGFTGDGIIAGCSKDGKMTPSRNNTIENIISADNRRQAITVGNTVGLIVRKSQFLRTGLDNGISSGTSPRCGVDFEPNASDKYPELSICADVLFEECVLADNQSYGVNVFRRVSGVTFKKCTIVRNGLGIVVVDGTDINVIDSDITDNRGDGVHINKDVKSGNISGNRIGRNKGREARKTPLKATGIVTGIGTDLRVADGAKINVGENQYV